MGGHPINHVILPLFLLELVASACLALIFYYLKYLDNFHQRRYPLLCSNLHWISYPFYASEEDHAFWLTDAGLYSACFFIPTVMVALMEIIRWFFYEGEKKVVETGCPHWKFHFFPRRVIRIVGTLLFGMLLTCVLTFTLKYLFAIPRPHFLAACQVNTTVLADACNSATYTATFTPSSAICMADAHTIDAALRSFPSEHAAVPAFSAFFLASYLHRMVSFRRVVTVRPALVAAALLGGLVPGVGTLQAFYNRWPDLLAGYLLGVVVAIYLTEVSLRRFGDRPRGQPTLLSLSQPVASPTFKSAPSVVTVEEDLQKSYQTGYQTAVLDGPGIPPGIPRARSNTTGQLYETANKIFADPSGGFVNRAGPRRRGTDFY